MKIYKEIIHNFLARIALIPFRNHKPLVLAPNDFGHSNWLGELVKQFNKPGIKILEIGARNVTGNILRKNFNLTEYYGFDLYKDDNVDIVGDAHLLSSYFNNDEKFDLIISSAVFEHLYMPWIVVEEINKLLNVGGYVFVETHFSFSAHERPWNFFQFSDKGLCALFNRSIGFEVIQSGMSNPIFGYYSKYADDYLRYRKVHELYCHSQIFCKKIKNINNIDWRKIKKEDLIGETSYPVKNN